MIKKSRGDAIMSYQCELCDKDFTTHQSLKYHREHNVCLKTYKKCEKCGHKFATNGMLTYHLSHHVCDQRQRIKIVLRKEGQDYSVMSREQLIQKLSRYEGEIKALKDHPQTVNIVVPPAFLQLDNYEQLPNLLHEALSHHPANFISYLIKETNCNPKHPIYNSVKLTNQKSSFVQISDGKQYVYASKKQIIDQLIQNKREILQEYVDQNGEKYGQKILNRYENYLEALDSTKDIQKELELDIIVRLLNMTKIIGSDDWSCRLLEELKSIEVTDVGEP